MHCQITRTLHSTGFRDHVLYLMKEWHVPGLAIALIRDDIVSSEAFGVATIHPPKLCTTDTLWDIASSSKSLTAAAMALLVHESDKIEEQHQMPEQPLRWDSVVNALLPEDFRLSEDAYTDEVTLEDILSHRTGLPRHDSSYYGQDSKTPDSAASVTRNLRNLPFSARIRTKYQYNNMMFTVATHLIETRTGTTFANFLRSKIFEPLGMASSFLHPSAAINAGKAEKLATPYSYHPSSGTISALPWPEDPEAQGAGGICTSVNDYIVYVQALMQKKPPFSEAIIEQLTTPRIISEADTLFPHESWNTYCLGWRSYYYRGHQVVLHFGGISGFGSLHFFLPAFMFGGVMMGNVPEVVVVQEILMRELIDQVIGVPKLDRLDWTSLLKQREQKQEMINFQKQAQLRRILLDGRELPEEQTRPLEAYLGNFHHPGYHTLQLEIREDRLFIDATDRSMGFTLMFEHVHSQTVYLVRQTARYNQADFDDIAAMFRFDDTTDQGSAMCLGLRIEPSYDDFIWFTRQD